MLLDLILISNRIVPNYELAPDLEHIQILRVVVRENCSGVLIDRLVADIVSTLSPLDKLIYTICSYTGHA